MQAGQIRIFDTLVKTRSELRKYARDENGIPNKKDDHLMDAMRYLVMSGLGIARPQVERNDFRPPRYSGKSNSWMAN